MPFDPTTVLSALEAVEPVVVLVMALAAGLEAAFGIGVVVPGETVVAVGAAVLGRGFILPVAWLAVAAGAFAGDQVGYFLGHRYGTAVAESWPVRQLGRDRWERAARLVRRGSFWVVVVARLLPGVRTLVSAAAGAAGVRYARFALADAVASTLWAAVWVLGGAAVGEALLGPTSWAVVGAAILAAVVVVRVRRGQHGRHGRYRAEAAPATGHGEGPDPQHGSGPFQDGCGDREIRPPAEATTCRGS